MIVPTGIGCPLGGHAGDANPAAQLLSAVCDELVVHPNVVNGSDINEMRENCLYVDGHALDLFLERDLALRRVRCGGNRILVVTNAPATVEIRNAVGAARATLGLDATMLELNTPLRMVAYLDVTGRAAGRAEGVEALIDQVFGPSLVHDALAISSEIDVERDLAEHYLRHGGVNPWGKVESDVSRRISEGLGVPVAHAPIDGVIQEWDEVVDDRLAAECVSVAYLHCVLKGLHRAPKLVPYAERRPSDLTVDDIDMLVSPAECWGRPHEACAAAGVEIVWVKENSPRVAPTRTPGRRTEVAGYLAAAGLIAARRVGVSIASVTRKEEV